ncbi:unnamed protein product, partial [Prorocentrum cordatum]
MVSLVTASSVRRSDAAMQSWHRRPHCASNAASRLRCCRRAVAPRALWRPTGAGGAMAARRGFALPLLALACALLALPAAFVPAPAGQAQGTRRGALALGTFGAAAAAGVLPAFAEKSKDYFILPELPGPFEVDPKEAIIVGDADAPKAKDAKAKVVKLLEEAEGVLAKLDEDAQADVSYAVQDFGIADLRQATNTINNLMDEATAAGTQ